MKKVVVFGATGKTGGLIVAQALEAGHQVTAAVRRLESFNLQHANLVAIRSDMYEPATVEQAIDGQEVVICAVAAPMSRKFTDIQARSARTLLPIMARVGISRFLSITSGGANPEHDPNVPFLYERVFKPMFFNLYSDQQTMEKLTFESAADWTIARPAGLTDGLRTGHYRLAAAYTMPGGNRISRADVADFLVKQIESSVYSRQAVAIAY